MNNLYSFSVFLRASMFKNSISKRNSNLLLVLISLLVLSFNVHNTLATTRYVRYNGGTVSNGDGTSWANAEDDLQTAIGVCVNGDVIYMTAAPAVPGYYSLPTVYWNKEITIYGGFSHSNPEADPSLRAKPANAKPWEFTNATIIKHVVGGDDKGCVFFTQGMSVLNYLDGLTLSDGGYSGVGVVNNQGAGIMLYTKTALRNCIVNHNKCGYGGGVYISAGSIVESSLIINNEATTFGANGGGGVNIASSGKILNSYISNNHSIDVGGGISSQGGGDIINCVVSNNTSDKTGGGIYLKFGSVINCTIVNNEAKAGGDNGKGIQTYDGVQNYIYNTVLWGNSGNGTSHITYTNGLPTVASCADPVWAGSLVLSNDNDSGTNPPYFVAPTGSTGTISFPNLSPSAVGNWDISSASALIGKGNNSLCSETTDLLGGTRLRKVSTIEIGAYEMQIVTIIPSNIVISNNSLVYTGSSQGATVTITPSVTSISEYKVQGSGDATYTQTPPTDAGVYDIRVTVTQSGYTGSNTGSLTITPKPITVSVGSISKTYSSNATSSIPSLTLTQGSGANQVVASDWSNVSVSATLATYDNKNVGSNKTITVTGISLAGSRSGNYSIVSSALNSTSTITTAPLTVSGVTANNKVYNGLNGATISGTALLVGKLGSDDVVLVASSSNTFASPNVATGIAVTSAFSLSGADKDNYSLAQPTLSANITPAPLSVTFASLVKTYDGNNSAAIPALTVVGIQNSESVTASATGSSYDTKNVGTGKTVTLTGVSFTAPNNGNYTLNATASNSLGVINAKDVTGTLTITFPDVSKTYDGGTSVAAILPANFTITGLVAGNIVTVASYTSAIFDTKHVGNAKVVTVSGLSFAGADVANYTLPSSTTNSNSSISKMAVTITVNAGQTKVYDKNAANPLTYTYSATALPGGDTYVGALVRNIGENAGDYPITQGTLLPKTVGESSAAANYDVTFVSKDFKITAKNLTIAGISAQNKIYDATTTATLTGGSLVGVVGVDDVSFSYTANFVSKNIGNGQTVNAVFSLNGSTAPNYTLTSPSGFTANISKRDINAVGFSIADKGADGNNSATIANWGVLQVIPGVDAGKVSINQTGVIATFDDVTGAAGVNKPVSVTPIALQGSEAANYNLIQPSGLKASINASQATFDWNGFLASVVYNGLGHPATVFVSNGGAVNTVPTIEYKDGLGNVILVPTDAGTYTIKATSNDLTWTGSETRTLLITPKTIPAATFVNGTKVYDATLDVVPQPTLVLTGIEARDLATVSASGDAAKYDLPVVGTHTVTINNVVLAGVGKDNYTIPAVASNNNWTISKLPFTTVPLVITFGNQSKVFDGNADVLPNGANTPIVITGFLPGDMFTAQAASASYDNKNVGIGNKTVTLSGITYSGAAAANYNLPTTLTNTTSSILPLDITNLSGAKMFINNQTKVYDADKTVKPISVPAVQLTGLLAGTTVIATGASASYDNKNVGVNKTVTVRGIVFSGADALNYTFPDSVQNLNSSITPISVIENGSLKLTFANQTKEYDATPIVLNGTGVPYVPVLTVQGLIAGDVVTALGTSATYNNKDVGVNKTVTVRGVQFGGADAINYVFADSAQNTNSSITAKTIGTQAWLSFANQTKVYDGTRNVLPVSVPAISVNGLVGADVVTAAGSIAFYDNKNVGVNKTVTIRNVVLSGKDKDNYLLADSVINTLSSITPRSPIVDTQISVSFANQTKVFDHTSKVWPDSTDTKLDLHGLVAGDVVTGKASSAYYVDPNVGVSKRVTLSGIIYSGADAGNYTLPNTVYNDTCSITKLDISTIPGFKIGFGQQSKFYDGSTVVTLGGVATIPTISVSGLLAGDIIVAIADSAAYDTKSAKIVKDLGGKIKTVTLSKITYSGSSKDNYTFPLTLVNDTCIINPVDAKTLAGFKISFNDIVKEYDGNTNAVINNLAIVSGLIAGDVVTVASSDSARFDTKNVGLAKTVTAYGIKYSGVDIANYVLPQQAFNFNCEIFKFGQNTGGLNINFAPCVKFYDGTDSVLIGGVIQKPILLLNGVRIGDDVSVVATKAFYDDKSAKINKTVTVTDLVISGADAANYFINPSYSTAVNTIQKLDFSTTTNISFNPISKEYDGTTVVATVPSLKPLGVMAGDEVTLLGSAASYDFSDASTTRRVTVSGIVVGGKDAVNYTFGTLATNDACIISRKPVTVTPNPNQSRSYDGVPTDLTYIVSPSLLPNNSSITLNGKLAYNGADNVGVYTILQGTVNDTNNPNYSISFSSSAVTFAIVSDIVILRKWGYTLLVNNIGDRFSAYQWYVDDILIPGATKQTYSNKDKSLCGKYVCEVTFKKNGANVKSPDSPQNYNCNKVNSYTIFPNLVDSRGNLTIKNTNGELTKSAEVGSDENVYKVEIYSVSGLKTAQITLPYLENALIEAPSASGVYVVLVTKNGDLILTEKVIVK